MAITTRKLGQILSIYECENGALICQLLMKRAESCNNFEGLDENGERRIVSKLELKIEVAFLDESRCRLKGITEKVFTVHASDWIELENSDNKTLAKVKVKAINFSSSADNKKDGDIVDIHAGCATDLVVEFDTEFCSVNFKEKQ